MGSRAPGLTVGSRSSAVIFWAAALLLLFWALGDRGLWSSEGRWAEVTREMFLTGDFFHPSINGEPYFDKPLLSYWLIALVSAISGRLDEWTVRLPSAISGLLGLWATICLGRRLWSEEVGRTAGWILLTTYGLLFWARAGTANMENLAAITLAIAWYWSRREKLNFSTYLVFYLISFLGAQAKGLTAVAVPIVAVLPDLLRGHRWRSLFTSSHLLAVAVGCLLYLAPFLYAAMTREGYQASGLAMMFKENIQRYFRPFDHREPFYLYLYYLPVLFLPWTPLLLTALLWTATSLKNLDRRTRWLAEAGTLIFLFFTTSGSRRGYYILPILPFCALFTSVFLKTEGKERWKRLGLGLQGGLLVLFSLIEILTPAVWPFLKERMGFVPPGDFRLVTPILGLLALAPWFLRRLWTGSRAATLVTTAVILMGGIFCLQQQSLEVYRTERAFAMELKVQAKGLSPKEIAFHPTVPSNVLFYLDLPASARTLRDLDSVRNFLESDRGVKILVSRRKYLNDLLPVLPAAPRGLPTLSQKVYPWQRESSSKFVAWKIRGPGE